MRALASGGVLSVTLWNKEEPPKSVLKLYATMAAAARDVDPTHMANSFFVASSYLSTATVLYKNGGFTPKRSTSCAPIHAPCRSMRSTLPASCTIRPRQTVRLPATSSRSLPAPRAVRPRRSLPGAAASTGDDADTPPGKADDTPPSGKADDGRPACDGHGSARLAMRSLLANGPRSRTATCSIRARSRTMPPTSPLTLKLGVACLTATVLLAIPLIWGWRAVFSKSPGKALTVLYFACLGAGYIMVEVGLIAHFVMALGNPTISASVLITGMLVFSGLGALTSERALPHMRVVMPVLFVAVGVMLILYGLYLGQVLDSVGRARVSGPPHHLLPFDRPSCLLDGLSDADRDDDAWPSRQRSHVCVGVGRQRLLFGDRGRGRPPSSHQFRTCSGDRGRRPGLPIGDPGLLWRHRFGARTRPQVTSRRRSDCRHALGILRASATPI